MARAGIPAWDEDESFFEERPARRRVRRKRRSWPRLILTSGLMIAGLVYLAQQKSGETGGESRSDGRTPVLIAPAPAWTPVDATPALYAIETSTGPRSVETRQHTSGAREDTVTMGRFGDPGYTRLTLVQNSSEPVRSFFIDIVRRAAQAGLAVPRTSQARTIATKFGPVEAASVTLAGSGERDCRAFRFSDGPSGFGFQGWTCGADAAPPDDARLACFIDGITLSGAGTSSMRALFARAERNRTEACTVGRAVSTGVRSPPRP